MKTTKTIGALLLAAMLGACTTTSDEAPAPSDLDIPMTKSLEAGKDESSTTKAIILETSAVLDWQKFFKAPPSLKERRLIEQRLASWAAEDTPENLLAKARKEAAVGQTVRAETTYRQLLRLVPEHLDGLLEVAQLFLKQNRLERAFDFLAQAKRVMDGQERVEKEFVFRYKYVLALGLIARGDRDKGHAVLSDLIAVDKTFSPAYAALASSYMAIGKLSVAEFIAMRGLDRGKKEASLTNVLAVIADAKGNGALARKWIDETLTLAPTYAPAYTNRARQALVRGEYEAAEADLNQAINLEPDNAETYVMMGVLKRRTGRFTTAKSLFDKAIELDPESAFARFNLAILMVEDLDEPNTALRLFHEVLQTASHEERVKELARMHIEGLRENLIVE